MQIKKLVQTSEKAYDFAKKRYDLSLLSAYELLNSQNNLLTAKHSYCIRIMIMFSK